MPKWEVKLITRGTILFLKSAADILTDGASGEAFETEKVVSDSVKASKLSTDSVSSAEQIPKDDITPAEGGGGEGGEADSPSAPSQGGEEGSAPRPAPDGASYGGDEVCLTVNPARRLQLEPTFTRASVVPGVNCRVALQVAELNAKVSSEYLNTREGLIQRNFKRGLVKQLMEADPSLSEEEATAESAQYFLDKPDVAAKALRDYGAATDVKFKETELTTAAKVYELKSANAAERAKLLERDLAGGDAVPTRPHKLGSGRTAFLIKGGLRKGEYDVTWFDDGVERTVEVATKDAANAALKQIAETGTYVPPESCFPLSSVVTIRDGAAAGPRTIGALRTGDVVQSVLPDGSLGWSPVIGLGHRSEAPSQFLSLRTLAGPTLRLSGGHFLPASPGDAACSGGYVASVWVAAEAVAVGDGVWVSTPDVLDGAHPHDAPGAPPALRCSPVVSITPFSEPGFSHPVTASLSIVVDSVAAHTFALPAAAQTPLLYAAHPWLLPLCVRLLTLPLYAAFLVLRPASAAGIPVAPVLDAIAGGYPTAFRSMGEFMPLLVSTPASCLLVAAVPGIVLAAAVVLCARVLRGAASRAAPWE